MGLASGQAHLCGAIALVWERAAEPALAPARSKQFLVRRELERRRVEPHGRRRTAEEVDVNAPNLVTPELDVAGPCAGVRCRGITTSEPRDEASGDGARFAFREHPGPRHGHAGHVADGVHVREAGRQSCRIDGDPAVDGGGRTRTVPMSEHIAEEPVVVPAHVDVVAHALVPDIGRGAYT
jgi:hypothetical protein